MRPCCGRLQQVSSRPLAAVSSCHGARRCRLAVCCTAQPTGGNIRSDSYSRSSSPTVAVEEASSSPAVQDVLPSSLDAGQLPDQLSSTRLVVVDVNNSTSTVVVSAAVSSGVEDSAEKAAVAVGAEQAADAEQAAAAAATGQATTTAATAAVVVAPWPAGSVPLEGLPSPQSVDASLNSSLTSFSSVDDDMLPREVTAAKQAAKARAAVRRGSRNEPDRPEPVWWPPIEFSALVALCVAMVISGLTNLLLCKPVMLSHCLVRQGRHKVMRECRSCCASPATQATHLVLMQRQPQRVLQPLPLPLRQYLELDQLPAPTYKVPSLVSLPGPGPQQGLTASLIAAQEWLYSRVAYQLQQLASANVSTKVLAIWLLALPFITLAAAVYQQAAAVSFKEAMYKVYALLMRVPGVGIAKEINTASYLVANTVFLAGVFSFAAVIGIVSDEIKTGIKNSRAGNYNMRLNGHLLLLNWNGSSTALLRHIASAYAEGGMFAAPFWVWNNRPPVVVLADRPKAEMDSLVHEMLKDRGLKLEVHTREGNPFKMSDLRKVAASKASTIIVLHPEQASGADAEAIKVSVAMSLTAMGGKGEQRVVVQGPSAGTSTVLSSLETTTRHAGGHCTIQAFELPDTQLTHRLVAQTAAQPGILTCWLDLLALTSSSAEFYTAPAPSVLAGKAWVDMRRAFLHAVLCGYRTPEGAVKLNPAETDVPPAGSRLILLGRGGAPHLVSPPGSSNLYESAATAAAERLKKERTYKSKARNILVTNWPMSGVPQLMESFSLFTPAGSTVSIVLPEEPPPTWPSRIGACRFNFLTSDNPTSGKVLLDAGIKSSDAVVLGSGPPVGSELEADARILAAVLQVQDAVMASKRRDAPHLVAPIRRYATSKLAAQFLDVLAAEQPPASTGTAAAATAAAVAAQGSTAQQQAVAAVLAAAQPAAAAVSGGSGGGGVAAGTPTLASGSSSSSSSNAPPDASSSSSSPAVSSSSATASASSSGSTSSSGSSSSGPAASTAAAAAAASKSSGGNLLTSALKAVGMLPASDAAGASAASSAQQQQQQRPPVVTEPEFLVPVDVASALMTQVVAEPAYLDIMRNLMLCNEGGSELYLRNPASFNIQTGVPVSFAEVQEAVRLTKQTAIGYIRGSGGHPTAKAKDKQRRQSVLGCSASHMVTFGEADRIVAIALDYNV